MDMIHEAELDILLSTFREIDEYFTYLSARLGPSWLKVNTMVNQIRVMLTAMHLERATGIEDSPFEFPPYLQRLWRMMASYKPMYDRFFKSLCLGDEYRFQSEYPPERRMDSLKLERLRLKALEAGLPTDEDYWTMTM